MSMFEEMTRPEVSAYFRECGDYLMRERDAFIAASERYWKAHRRHGSFEQDVTCERFIEEQLDCAHGGLAEEVREFLEW